MGRNLFSPSGAFIRYCYMSVSKQKTSELPGNLSGTGKGHAVPVGEGPSHRVQQLEAHALSSCKLILKLIYSDNFRWRIAAMANGRRSRRNCPTFHWKIRLPPRSKVKTRRRLTSRLTPNMYCIPIVVICIPENEDDPFESLLFMSQMTLVLV